MIFPLPKTSLILSIGLFSVVNSSTINAAGSDEGYRITRTSAHRYGQVRTVEGEPTAPVGRGYGHHYVPGQNQPPLTRATTDTSLEPQTVKARQISSPLIYPSYAPFVYDLNATATTLTTRTGVRSFTGSVAYTLSSVIASGAASTTPDYQSVTISSAQPSTSVTQQVPTQEVTSPQIVTSIMSTLNILMSTLTIGNPPAVQPSPLTTILASVTATEVAGSPAVSSGIISELASLTGVPWTLPPCQGPSPGPGLTPVGCTFANSESTPLPTTTYSWSEVVNVTVGGKSTSLSPLRPSLPNLSQSQNWTSDSVPCPGNSSYECVVNGTSTVTLGLISQILGLGGATGTPVSPPGTGNLPPNWAENLTRCPGNTNMACLVASSSTTTLGPIAKTTGIGGASATFMSQPGSVNSSQSWTSNSTPCANDTSWECVDTPSGIVTLGPIASLKYTEFSTSDSTPCANNKSLECVNNGSSTITLGLISMLTAAPSSSTSETSINSGFLSTILSELGITRLSSTTSNLGIATTSADKMNTPSTVYSSKLVSSTSTSGAQTVTTSISVTPSPIACPSNTSMECLVNGESTFTAEASQKTSPKSTSAVVIVTTVTATSLPTTSTKSSPAPHSPYPYPSVQSGSAKILRVPLLFLLFCSLVSMANSIDLRSMKLPAEGSVYKDPPSAASSSSTDVLYGPLVSSIAEILSATSVEPDGNWGIGVPPATTSSYPHNIPSGGGIISSGTTSTFVNNGQYGGGGQSPTSTSTFAQIVQDGGGQSKSPSVAPASASVTRAIIQMASTTFSPFPTNFIHPVTDDSTTSASAASQSTAMSSTSSTVAKSGSSKRLKAPLLILFLCSLLSLGVATMTPRAISLTTEVASIQSRLSIILPSPGPCASNSAFECVVQSGSTITLGTIKPQTTGASPTPAGPNPCAANPTLECIVQGGNTVTVGTLLPQSTPTMVSASQSTEGTLPPPNTFTTSLSPQTTSGVPPTTSMPVKSGAFKFKTPFLLLLLCSLSTLVTASLATSLRGIEVSTETNPRFPTWNLSTLPIVPTTDPVASESQSTTGVIPTPSTLTTAPMIQTTGGAPAATSEPAKSGAFNVKIPFLLLLFCSLTSLVTGTMIPSRRGIKISSNINPMFPTWDLSALPAPPTIAAAASTSQSLVIIPVTYSNTVWSFSSLDLSTLPAPAPSTTMSLSSLPTDSNPMPYMTACPSNTNMNCVMAGGNTISSWSVSSYPPLQTTSAVSTTFMLAASTIPMLVASTNPVSPDSQAPVTVITTVLMPCKTATSGSSRVKAPSLFLLLLLLLSSLVSQAMAQGGRSATTLTITSQQPIIPSAIHTGSPISVTSNAAMPVMPATSAGVKRIAAPFLVLIIYCLAATFYSAGLYRKRHRGDDEVYDSGWVIQRGEWVDKNHEVRKDH